MSKPLISIITPTYNHEDYIGECIESVLGQTYDNWEQIIVDDCSPDKTLEKICSYKDSRIRVVQKQKRGGPSNLHKSYNTALRVARGELIAILEGDDYWPKDKLEKQVPVHEKNIVLSWGLYAKRIQNKTVLPRRKYNLHKQRNYPSLNELLTGNMIPAVTVMISKTELCGIGGFWQPDGAVLVDHPTWLSLRRIGRFVFIPEILGVFRIHAQQISNVHSAIMNESAISYIEDIVSKLDMTEKKKINMCHVTAELYLRRASLSEEVSNTIRAKIYYRKVLALGNLHQRIAALKRILRLCQDN